MKKKLTSENLKQELWETLHDIRNKKIEANTAQAIASQAREILRAVRLELIASNMTNKKILINFVNGSKQRSDS